MTNSWEKLMSRPSICFIPRWENLLNKITKNINKICTKFLQTFSTNIVYLWIFSSYWVFEGGYFHIKLLTLNTHLFLRCHGLKWTSPTVEHSILGITSDHQAYLWHRSEIRYCGLNLGSNIALLRLFFMSLMSDVWLGATYLNVSYE